MTQTITIDALGYLADMADRYGYDALINCLDAAMDVLWRADGEADPVVHACLSHLQDALSDLISFGEAWDQ